MIDGNLAMANQLEYSNEPVVKGNCSNCVKQEIVFFDKGGYQNIYCGQKEPDETFIKFERETPSVLGDRYCRCNAGFNDVLEKFWKEYGNKPSSANKDVVFNCHEPHESSKLLDKMKGCVDEMLELLKKNR